MTIAQIGSIISLLLAFGVPQSQANTIQLILQAMPTSTQTTISTPVENQQSSPNFGGIMTPMPEDLSGIQVIQKESDIKDAEHGAFFFEVSVLDAAGNPLKGQVVHLEGQDNSYTSEPTNPNTNRVTNAQTCKEPNGDENGVTPTAICQGNWHTNFEFMPTSSGDKTVTFTSGSLSKTLTIIAP